MGKLKLQGDQYYFLVENQEEKVKAKLVWCKEKQCYKLEDWVEAIKLKNFSMDNNTSASLESYENNFKSSYRKDTGIFEKHEKCFDYQIGGLYEMKRRMLQYQCALLADEQGLGKTIQVAKLIEDIYKKKNPDEYKILIISPATLKLNWKKELENWCNTDLKIQIINSSKDWVDENCNVIIVNYDLLVKPHILSEILETTFYLAVIDEAHYLKNYKTLRTKATYKILKNINHKIALTGTPVLNRPIELFSMIKCLGADKILGYYAAYQRYGYRYCNGSWGAFGMDVSGSSNLEELNYRLRSTIMIRREKKDVLQQLPEKTYQIVPLDQNRRTRNISKQLQELDIEEIKNKPDLGTVGEISKLRNELAMEKIEESIAYIKLLLESKDKIVLFAYHRNIIGKLKDAFKDYGVVVVSGSETSSKKFKAVESFQSEKEIRVFVGQINSAGVGITLTASDTVVFVETSWVPGEVEQAVDRCHRIGQDSKVSAQFLVVENSIDEFMLQSIIKKKNIINTIIY